MKLRTILFTLVTIVFLNPAHGLVAQDAAAGEPAAPAAMNEQEQAFSDRLENARFTGRWSLVAEGKIGEERTDEYLINSATKVRGDDWVIVTRMRFGTVDVNVPITVQVKWAGDTPVISVSELAIPNVGTYSARVVVDKDQYGGSWRGQGYGGLMYGVIEKREAESEPGE